MRKLRIRVRHILENTVLLWDIKLRKITSKSPFTFYSVSDCNHSGRNETILKWCLWHSLWLSVSKKVETSQEFHAGRRKGLKPGTSQKNLSSRKRFKQLWQCIVPSYRSNYILDDGRQNLTLTEKVQLYVPFALSLNLCSLQNSWR